MLKDKEEGALNTALQSLVQHGDLSRLSAPDRAKYYTQMCEQLGLNPHSQPFAYLRLNGKEILYATRGATDQLAARHLVNREIVDGPKAIDLAGTKLVFAVCRATLPNGRFETATATVPLTDPVNVLMKAETKAKRRATLSILGLGLLDETEAEQLFAQGATEGPGIDLAPAQQDSKAEAPKAEAPKVEASLQDKPDTAPPSRAWASFCATLPGLTSARAVADLYLSLQRDLTEEGIEPAEYTQDSEQGPGGGTLARKHIATLGHRCSAAELQELLVNPAMAGLLDTQTAVSTMPQACAWWRSHREATKALEHNAREGLFLALARRLADEQTPAGTKRAKAALKAAIEAADKADQGPPKGPGGGGGAPAPSAPSGTSAAAPSAAAAPGTPAVNEYKAHLAKHRDAGGVAGSWWKHRSEFEDCEAEARAAVLDELGRRDVADPRSFLDAIGEKNGYLQPEREAA